MDRDVVGAAASIFIVSSIKVPNHTNELISTEMNHELPDQRINAILRFQVSSCHLKNDLTCFLVKFLMNFLSLLIQNFLKF